MKHQCPVDPIEPILDDMFNVIKALRCFRHFAEAMETDSELAQRYEAAIVAITRLRDKYAQHNAVNNYVTLEI